MPKGPSKEKPGFKFLRVVPSAASTFVLKTKIKIKKINKLFLKIFLKIFILNTYLLSIAYDGAPVAPPPLSKTSLLIAGFEIPIGIGDGFSIRLKIGIITRKKAK